MRDFCFAGFVDQTRGGETSLQEVKTGLLANFKPFGTIVGSTRLSLMINAKI